MIVPLTLMLTIVSFNDSAAPRCKMCSLLRSAPIAALSLTSSVCCLVLLTCHELPFACVGPLRCKMLY